MTEWTVLSSLCEITQMDADERAAVLPLCRSALDALLPQCKADADPDDPRIARAAAADAYYKQTLRLLSKEQNVTSFKAGDVTVSQSASAALELAERVRKEAYLAVLPLLIDPYFIFECV